LAAFLWMTEEMMAVAQGSQSERAASPWRRRLHAWWEGADLAESAEPPADVAEPTRPAVPLSQQVDRLAISQMLWGPGFLEPGGPDHVLNIVKPFGCNPAMSMLDLSGGLGGPARLISSTFDIYITARERIAAIAERGLAMSVDAGMAKKAPVTAYDPEALELRAGAFDCAFAQQLLFGVENKDKFLATLKNGLKARGNFAFTDYVLLDGGEKDLTLKAWKTVERVVPHLWTRAQYEAGMKTAGFDVRIVEDISDQYRGQIVQGWGNLIRNVNLRKLPKPEMLALMDEAELWIYRLNALNAKALGVMRFYALSTKSAALH